MLNGYQDVAIQPCPLALYLREQPRSSYPRKPERSPVAGLWDDDGLSEIDEATDANADELAPGWATLDDCRASGWARYCQEIPWLTDWEITEWLAFLPELRCSRVGHVSIWLGVLPNPQSLDLYVGLDGLDEVDWEGEVDWSEVSPFSHDLALSWVHLGFHIDDGVLVFRYAEDGVSIFDLLAECPYAISFCVPLADRCRELGMEQANSLICLYDVDYVGPSAFALGRLKFVDSFRYSRAAN